MWSAHWGSTLKRQRRKNESLVLHLVKQGTVLFCRPSCNTMHNWPLPYFPICTMACSEGELIHLAGAQLLEQQGKDGWQTGGGAGWLGCTSQIGWNNLLKALTFFGSLLWSRDLWKMLWGNVVVDRLLIAPEAKLPQNTTLKWYEKGKCLSFSLELFSWQIVGRV